MRRDLFLIPSLRRAIGAVAAPELDPDFSNGSWPTGITAASLDNLAMEWSGVIRALMLAGYDVTHARVEIDPLNQTELHEVDLNTLRLGSFPPSSDDLDAIRANGPTLLVSWVVTPRQLYLAAGPPIALDLASIEVNSDAITTFTNTQTGHLAIALDGPTTLADAKLSLRAVAIDVATLIADEVASSFFSHPDWNVPVGLAWALDPREWRFPPEGLAHSDGSVMSYSEGGRSTRDALVGPWIALEQGAIDPLEFVTDQVVRHSDQTTWHPDGRLRRVIRELQGSGSGADALQTAAYQRAFETEGVQTAGAASLIAELPQLGYVDAMLAMIDRGLADPFWSMELRENGITDPEWTDPALTGQWDEDPDPSSTRLPTHTILLNQAGDRLEGYWQGPYSDLPAGQPPEWTLRSYERWTLSAVRDQSAPGIVYNLSWWDKPSAATEPHDRDALGTPLGTGTMVFTPSAGSETALEISYSGTGGSTTTQRFSRKTSEAHHTTRTLEIFPPQLAARYRARRDAPLHTEHLPEVDAAIDVILDAMTAWEDAGWDNDLQRADQLDQDLANALLPLWRDGSGGSTVWLFSDQVITVQDAIRARLSHRPDPSSATYYEELFTFVHRLGNTLERLQGLVGIHVPSGGQGGLQRWQWRLVNPVGTGGEIFVGGQLTSATIEFRRLDDDGNVVDEEDFPIVLLRGSLSNTFGESSGESATDWASFYPVTDVWSAEDFSGASVSMLWGEASWTAFELSSAGNIWMESSQHNKVLEGPLDAAWSDPFTDPMTLLPENPADLKEVESKLEQLKEMRDAAKDVAKKGWRGLKSIKPDFRANYLYGWIDEDRPPEPEQLAVLDPNAHMTSFSGTLFETGDAELTDDYREVVRRLLCAYLPILRSSAGELTLIGTASHLGSEEDNVELSRQRAITVLQAIRDILGPQLALPSGAIALHPLGETLASGDAHSDLPDDRRVDVLLGGRVALRG